jgi:hypothetical protein
MPSTLFSRSVNSIPALFTSMSTFWSVFKKDCANSRTDLMLAVHQRGLDVVYLRTLYAASLRRILATVLVSDSRCCVDSPCVSFFQTHRESP